MLNVEIKTSEQESSEHWPLIYCHYPYFKCSIIGLEIADPYQKQKKKNETFESLWRTLDCEYTKCYLDINYSSIINLRCSADCTKMKFSIRISPVNVTKSAGNLGRSIPDAAETLNFPLVIAMQNSPTVILLNLGQHPEKVYSGHLYGLLIEVVKLPVF